MPSPIILLTGFGPFPGIAVNATGELVPRLAKATRRRFGKFRVRAHILPTDWSAGPVHVVDLITRLRPAIALHFGVSAQARGFQLEAQGLNICRPSADAAGALPNALHLVADGPASFRASLDAGRAAAHLQRLGLAACVSDDAGGYLCNAILYHSLRHSQERGSASIVGFVHVPARIGADSNDVMSWADAERGALEILAVAVEQRRDLRAEIKA